MMEIKFVSVFLTLLQLFNDTCLAAQKLKHNFSGIAQKFINPNKRIQFPNICPLKDFHCLHVW